MFKYLYIVFFGIALISLTRQFPFNTLSSFIAISLFMTVFFYFLYKKVFIRKVYMQISFLILFLSFLAGYSIINDNNLFLIVRFFIVLFLVNAVVIFSVRDDFFIKIFSAVFLIQALIIISIAIYMPLNYSIESYSIVRTIFKESSWGDVYTYNGFFYRVQVVGNALLPLYFYYRYVQYRKYEKSLLLLVISALGCIYAGNMAFWISILIFISFYEMRIADDKNKSDSKIKWILFFISFLCSPIILMYTIDLLIMKSSGDISSIGSRVDQVITLFSDFDYSYLTVILGKGLGNTLSVITKYRDYTDDVYFELQTVYFLNQLGFLNFIILFLFHTYIFLMNIKLKECRLMYVCYLLYAFTNPYILDSNHIIALIFIISLDNLYQRNNIKYSMQ